MPDLDLFPTVFFDFFAFAVTLLASFLIRFLDETFIADPDVDGLCNTLVDSELELVND